jgi:hypothetical protein
LFKPKREDHPVEYKSQTYEKKERYESYEDSTDEYSRIPIFDVKAKKMDTDGNSKLLLPDNMQLRYFSYKNGEVYLRMKGGKELTSRLQELHVSFSKIGRTVSFNVQSDWGSLKFYKMANFSDKEWDAIASILNLAGNTSGSYAYSKDYQVAGKINKAKYIVEKL